MKEVIKNTLKKAGVQVKRYPELDIKRRMQIVQHFQIDTLFDIGANAGQYSLNMRELGFSGQIHSFEPLSSAFQKLSKEAAGDKLWSVHNFAMGDSDSTGTINISENSYSSSLLEMLPAHVKSAPESQFIAQEEITIKKLDTVFPTIYQNGNRVMVKIDTQGFEKNVIDGASECLSKIQILQLEMSLVPLYQNEMLFLDMAAYLGELGFELYSLENGFANPETGQLLQVDGIFSRRPE